MWLDAVDVFDNVPVEETRANYVHTFFFHREFRFLIFFGHVVDDIAMTRDMKSGTRSDVGYYYFNLFSFLFGTYVSIK